jgi:glycosyltransferase involved in cell wall biosynthesis/GT2 family glycosyltransferase
MSTGIVVLAYGPHGQYRPLVESLLAEGVAPEAIAIVHNPATPGEPALDPPGGVPVLRTERNLGYAGGMNAGIAHWLAHGADPIVLFTHDVRIERATLELLVEASRRLPAYGVLAPAQALQGSDEPFSFGGRVRRDGTVGHIVTRPRPGADGVSACDWVDGGAMVLRREVLERVGGFDERFFAYCEEAELCLRVTRAGWRVGVLDGAVAEQAPGGARRPGAWAYLISRNGLAYARAARGRLGLAGRMRQALGQAAWLGLRTGLRRVRLRPGDWREPWVEVVGILRGISAYRHGRWGPPPADLPGLGDMSVTGAASGPRVLHLGPDPRTAGGMPAVLRGLLASPLAERYRLEVVPTYADRRPLPRLGRFAVALARLGAWSLAGRGRIVHVHTAARGSMYRKSVVVLVAKALRRRVVLQVHAGVGDLEDFTAHLSPPARWLVGRGLARADVVLSVSAAGAAVVTRAFGREGIEVVPNPAPAVEHPPPLPNGKGDLALLYLGGFADPAKGADVLLEALPRIAERCPELAVILAGPGEPPAEAQALLANGGRVGWRAWLDEPRKAAAFAEAQLVVFPSRSEGLPVSLLEALANGRAIVATAVGGMPEVLTDEVDALLVRGGDASALADAVCRLSGDAALRARLGAAARERALRLNDEEVAGHLDRIYSELLAR